ncbi:hypothetical protein SEUCBS140593_008816 [Sporothrix eucalyptigena]|uniref:Transcription factor domain-containing protein n=1 Tax=Sporothrix eucalyptigena TaxID=1812306 RepID=A0ABP0CRW2_9PEZI
MCALQPTERGMSVSYTTADYAFLPVPSLDLELDITTSYLGQTDILTNFGLDTPNDFNVSNIPQPFLNGDVIPLLAPFASTSNSSASPLLNLPQDAVGNTPKSAWSDSFTPPSQCLGLVLATPQPVSTPFASANWNYASRIIATHLRHAMDIIRDAPRLLVLENRLPWSHPLLYRDHMPRSMEDAMSSCALYLAKNSSNSPIILRTVDARMQDLLAAPEPSTPLECVAHVQALLLYNIISIFDGDINARATVEKTQPQLQHAAKRLLSFITFDPPPATMPDALFSARAFWEAWVFMESARRTFLMSLYFVHLYYVVVGTPSRNCDERKYLNRYWTISASLWHATDPVEFSGAWHANRFFLARVGTFSQLLEEARSEDIDEFSQIFLSSLMGIDEFRNWMDKRAEPDGLAEVPVQVMKAV